MPRRKAGPCEAKPNSTNQLSPRLSLLSLPPEIRFMIWEYVLGNSVLLRSLIAAASVDPSKLSCLEYHAKALGQTENCSSLFEKRPGLLSWLRTNRQIHTEAQPLVYQNICLHVCFPMDLRHLLSFSTSTSQFRLKDIQCLSVCTNIGIYHDLHDGFTIKPPERNYQRDPFIPKHSLPMRCYGAWRWSQFDEDLPHDGETLDQRMPGLKEVRVRLYFTCLSHQVNNRPVSANTRTGGLRWASCIAQRIRLHLLARIMPRLKEVAKRLCMLSPLRLLRGGKIKTEELQLQLDHVGHNSSNAPPDPNDICWCKHRRIDEFAFPGALLMKAIREQLSLSEN